MGMSIVEQQIRANLHARRLEVATHQRKCANKHRVREWYQIECDHSEMDTQRYWCCKCGGTIIEIIYGRGK